MPDAFLTQCPLCSSPLEIGHKRMHFERLDCIQCSVCGCFQIDTDIIDDKILEDTKRKSNSQLRSYLSHMIRLNNDDDQPVTKILPDWLDDLIKKGPKPPTPAEQANNIVGFIGDRVSETGNAILSLPPHFHAVIGAPNRRSALHLVNELLEGGLITGSIRDKQHNTGDLKSSNLTLAGWERYEKRKRGEFKGSYGFLALKFGDETLDKFIGDVVKPAAEAVGYNLFDLRDIPEAGLIDNLMRQKIRDSAFVVADLTHDNSGAYWEAGYAEGLGKPVLYICEKTKFSETKTHFDTNHSTTVIWDVNNPDDFKRQFIATLQRSLNIFT